MGLMGCGLQGGVGPVGVEYEKGVLFIFPKLRSCEGCGFQRGV